ncbi:MAG: hypothetical protein HUU02_02005 [Bacteroidetes bacterium]|nr:hypothetical protein [Bacteroidota bacterium]
MKRTIVLQIVLVLMFAHSLSAQAGMTAYPFLTIGTSMSGNGMGEIRGTLNNGSTLQATFNPGLLGIHSTDHSFSAELYSQRTSWLPGFHLPDLTLNSFALSARIPYSNAADDPYPATIGVGWSTTYLNLGEFVFTTEQGPTVVGTFKGYERVDGVSAGIGVEYGGRFGLGLGIKNIISSLAPIGTMVDSSESKATNIAFDLGFFAEFPMIGNRTFGPLHNGSILIIPDLTVAASYTYRNIGGTVTYNDPAQTDPLPREIVIGLSLSGGLAAEIQDIRLPLLSFLFAREASDIAVVGTGPNDWSYQYGIGDVDLVNHLLFGRSSSFGRVTKGSSVSFARLVTLLEGSNAMVQREPFRTKGTMVHVHGIFPYLQFLLPSLRKNTAFSYLTEHLQLNYIQSSYSGVNAFPLNGTKFEGLTVSWR